MDLLDFVQLVPEDKREEYKQAAAFAVVIKSKEDVERQFESNQFFKGARDATISRTTQAYEEKFKTEKMQALVEEEIKKRNPSKDPKDQAIEELTRKFEEAQKQNQREKLTAQAIKKAADLGLPVELVERFIGDSPEATDENIANLHGVLKPWAEAQINAVNQAKYGNMGRPPAGNSAAGDIGKMTVTEQMAYAKTSPEAQAQVLAWHNKRK